MDADEDESSDSSTYIQVAEATLSPSSNFINLTPWVERDNFGI